MRFCKKCKLDKNLENFYKDRHKCKECFKKDRKIYNLLNKDKTQSTNKKWYKNNKNKAKENTIKKITKAKRFKEKILKKFPCNLCGFSDVRYLEFDHINPVYKKYRISSMCSEGRTLFEIKEEMRKCQILCVACHKEKTRKDIKKSSSYFSKRTRKQKIEHINFIDMGIIPVL